MRILLLLLPFFLNANVTSEKFQFRCVVLDQIVFQLQDGKSSKYSSYKDGLKNGDSFYLDFELEVTNYPEKSVLNGAALYISENVQDLIIGTWILSSNEFSDDIERTLTKGGTFGDTSITESGKVTIESVFGTKTHISRYYKDDYQMSYTADIGVENYILNANCMNNEKLTKALETMFEWADKIERN